MAFLPIWHGIEEGHEDVFEQWHTEEHLAERVDTPGIVVGRRYAKAAGDSLRYFTLYEATSFEVFASDGYFATANARSERTIAIHPYFVDFRRAPCNLVMTRGRGYSGDLLTVRVRFVAEATAAGVAAKDAYALGVRPIVEGCISIPLVTGAHAGATAPVARKPLSATSLSLRPNATAFDGVLLVEFASRRALEAGQSAVASLLERHIGAIATFEFDRYSLSQLIFDRSA